MSKATAGVPTDKLELYEKLVATIPGVPRKERGSCPLYLCERTHVQLLVEEGHAIVAIARADT